MDRIIDDWHRDYNHYAWEGIIVYNGQGPAKFSHLHVLFAEIFIPLLNPSSSSLYTRMVIPPRLFTLYKIGSSSTKETLQLPVWDYKSKTQLTTKTYKAIAMFCHYGPDNASGHYKAFIYFNSTGWFEHNDNQVSKKTSFSDIINTPSPASSNLILYELQD